MLVTRVVIIFLASLVFAITNLTLGGYMSSYEALGNEIASPATALFEWHLNQKAPFEYRMLFPAIVLGIWRLTEQNNEAFYWTYVGVSLLFLIGAALSFFQLLLQLKFSRKVSLVGVIIFLMLPPLSLAYTLPVHTREDTLAYILLCTGLLFLLRKKYIIFTAICCISVLCRETLLILPFVFLFFTYDFTFIKRIVIAALPFIVWFSIRILIDTNQVNYDPLEGLKWNLANPLQLVAFLFITFGPLWLSWLWSLRTLSRFGADNRQGYGRSLLARSSIWVIPLIIITTFLGGIYNEIRLIYLGFPWVIALSLVFVEDYKSSVEVVIRSRQYILYSSLLFLLTVAVMYSLINKPNLLSVSTQYDVPIRTWLNVGILMGSLTLAVAPVLWLAGKQSNYYSRSK